MCYDKRVSAIGNYSRKDGVILKKNKVIIIGVIAAVIIVIGLIVFGTFFTESGKRALKSTKSNWLGGINRTVSVYSMDGKLIKSYEGSLTLSTVMRESYSMMKRDCDILFILNSAR